MERETHSDNDHHIIDIPNGDDSLYDESYSSARSSLSSTHNDQDIINMLNDDDSSSISSLPTDEETSTSGCDSRNLGNSVELVFALVQTFAALVVLTPAKDEQPQTLLLAWLIGYTCGCIISMLLSMFWCLRMYNQEAGEYPRTRSDGVVKNMKMGLECFFIVWLILGIVWICDGHSSPSDAPKHYRLCVAFIVYSCIRFAAGFLIWLCSGKESEGGGTVFQGPTNDDVSSFVLNVLTILVVLCVQSCCICLVKYGEKEGATRKLECSHVFHLECIDKWLRVKPTCPLCQTLVRG
ncbi:unnamed protein product [Thlaspi arvense]|uniref:RING-type domain-containing protein n=1 Tax=Thlaspi arvense TaxID=13288 RepID=A0AAU9RBC7_THLAR|nr:unnamed protein product [Thlaspi arvense]